MLRLKLHVTSLREIKAHNILEGNLKRRQQVEGQDIDGRIIIKWIFDKWGGNKWTGFICLRIGISTDLM
jgi:hypothetical protein